ncbi:hypothetical protein JQ580_33430 [Bradyrhizobium japonicum]|uniref:hypothetical protein n=1 Tax=Bradyrhizobium japonicum TaxID=375 RepID=UPI001BA84513|nr:hypothetical protein [Bradyrhizobium japonicum]MBR0995618.1 hypothetical protein [Bradyrhizobium japonicum]
MNVFATPNIRPGRVFVVEDGELAVDDGPLDKLVRTDGDDSDVEVYLHPIDAPAFCARWMECGLENGRLN